LYSFGIVPKTGSTVGELIQSQIFSEEERDAYDCVCGCQKRHWKRTLDNFADVLIVSINHNMEMDTFKLITDDKLAKITDDIYVDAARTIKYSLFGITFHDGEYSFRGHYTAYARKWEGCGLSQHWHFYDDEKVHFIHVDSIQDAQDDQNRCSMLFYRRQ
jgi:uncharacterized UBP type Zn finger protein